MTEAVATAGWVRVGAYALVVDRSDRLLLVREPEPDGRPGRWWMPGGGLEFGEDPAEAVLRELTEETGLTGEVIGLVGSVSTILETTLERPGERLHALGFVYRVAITGGDLRDEVGGSTEACGWFERSEVERLPLAYTGEVAAALAWPDR